MSSKCGDKARFNRARRRRAIRRELIRKLRVPEVKPTPVPMM